MLTTWQGILRQMKGKELAVADVVEDYETAGQDLVQRTARLHANERRQLEAFCKRQQREYRRSCDDVRRRAASFAKQIYAIDLNSLSQESSSSSTINRLGKFQQTLSEV